MPASTMTFRTSAYALLAATSGLAATAVAQPMETVTVEAAREVTVGQTSTGIPITEFTVKSRVSFADLDLTTDAGVKTLKDRVRTAAANACKEINVRVPSAGTSDRDCVEQAVAAATQDVDAAIAAKRGAASK